ncbi:MAG TPA: RluA family pseudouridine synthase [Candidatus Methylomirabilis sp.]
MAPGQGPDHAIGAGAAPPRIFEADAAAAGQRLDVFLARAAGLTRAQAQRLIAGGYALVEGRAGKASQAIRPGQRIALALPPAAPSALIPQPLPLDIVHEDDDLLVVNKPPGLVVHPAAGHREGTLANALLYHRPHLQGVGAAERPGIVHRLDKDTSGLLLVAKTHAIHAALAAQFETREVEKRYLALVHGVPRRETGTIDAAVGRHESDRKRMGVRTRKGREALTYYRVVERLGDYALMELAPRTGRTHQLRVHLAHLGHPVLGDAVYGGRRERARRAAARPGPPAPAVQRQMLHAWKLAFRHPRTGERVEIEAPLPPDIATLLAALRAASPKPP